MRFARSVILSALAIGAGCAGTPDGIAPVTGFDLSRYLGTWYEIARLDHHFERGLSNVSAVYTLREDQGIDVHNRGYDDARGEWREARGRAYVMGDPAVASLSVTFFWPFYGGYHVIALDQDDYAHALVCGPNRSYLWILAREPRLDQATRDRLIGTAKDLGFDTDGLIMVRHDPEPPPQ